MVLATRGKGDLPQSRNQQDRFEAIYAQCSRQVLAYAFRRLESREDAADVLSETFLVAWRRIDQVPPGDEARAWLIGVARNVLSNYRRGQRRGKFLELKLKTELREVVESTPEDQVLDPKISAALDRLSESDRELLTLSIWDELDPVEIAIAMDMNRATVRSRLHRAKTRFRNSFEGLEEKE